MEWSFEVEQPLTQRNVLAVTYSGNHGYDESYSNTSLNNYDANPAKFPTNFLGLRHGARRSTLRDNYAGSA